jgi:hypothetical protein
VAVTKFKKSIPDPQNLAVFGLCDAQRSLSGNEAKAWVEAREVLRDAWITAVVYKNEHL